MREAGTPLRTEEAEASREGDSMLDVTSGREKGRGGSLSPQDGKQCREQTGDGRDQESICLLYQLRSRLHRPLFPETARAMLPRSQSLRGEEGWQQ